MTNDTAGEDTAGGDTAGGDTAGEETYGVVHEAALGWLKENWDPDLTVRAWWKLLADSRWAFPSWPREWFGQGLSAQLVPAVTDAFAVLGALRPPHSNGQWLAAPTLITHASDELNAQLLPPLVTGEEYWCQFFSEPGSGSDLASLQTRAIRDGDEWVINGQKVWTSGAQYADRGMLVARTNVDAPKHRGITYFIIDVDQPGIEIRPLHQMNGGHGFNEVFFTDARVGHDRVVGEVNNGWAVALTTLAFERFPPQGGVGSGRKIGLLDARAGDVASGAVQGLNEGMGRRFGEPSEVVRDAVAELDKGREPVVRQRVTQLHILSELSRLTGLRSAAAAAAGNRPGPEGSIRKLAVSTINRTARDTGMSVLGAHGMVIGDDTHSGGEVQQIALTAFAHSIAGGTDEIQHNILGERVLGLPREPSVDRDVPFRELKIGTQRSPG